MRRRTARRGWVMLGAVLLSGCGGKTGLGTAPDGQLQRDAGPGPDRLVPDGAADQRAPDRGVPDLPPLDLPTGPWVTSAGTPGVSAHVAGQAIVTDEQGQSYVTGSYMGKAWFGSQLMTFEGAKDLFVSKLDPSGAFLWTVRAGGEKDQSGLDIARDKSGNLILAGEFEGLASFGATSLTAKGGTDVFVAKLGPSGGFLWVTPVGGADWDGVGAVSVDGQGNICLAGYYRSSIDIGPISLTAKGEQEIFVARLDPAGKVSWALSAGSPGYDRAEGVAMDPAGNCVVVGSFNNTITFGQLTLAPLSPPPSPFAAGCFVVKLDGGGGALWGKVTATDVTDVAVDASGNVYTVGFGVTVTKRDPAGNPLWTKQIPASTVVMTDRPRIAVDANGQSYVSAAFEGTVAAGPVTLTSAGGKDVLVSALDSTGKLLWVKAAGGAGDDRAGDVAPLAGGAVATGGFTGTAAFGSLALTADGYEDLFVWRVAP